MRRDKHAIPEFSERFIRYNTREFGDAGIEWRERLPSILAHCCEKWGLPLGPMVEEVKVNYVGYAKRPDGQEVVFKVGRASTKAGGSIG